MRKFPVFYIINISVITLTYIEAIMSSLTFLGAAQQVTGSCYLLETDDAIVLMECGIRQGADRDKGKNQDSFKLPESLDPSKLDAVIISHAHLDHSGLIPLLSKQGFTGPIYCSQATADLLPIMLMDAASLQKSDIERKNRKRLRAGKNPLSPAYDFNDVNNALDLVKSLGYDSKTKILKDISITFQDAGHILGSSIVEIYLSQDDKQQKIVFSGDLGNCCAPLMNDPAIIDQADIVLMESTYGDRNHKSLDNTLEEFRNLINEATSQGGNILIPAFAVGRTQDLIYWLGMLYHEGLLNNNKVYIDSPMAIKVSKVYKKNNHLFNDDNPAFRNFIKQGWDKWLPILSYTESTEESMSLNRISDGAIIIAGSGMCTGGRILHHLKYNLWNKKTHVVIVGFQAIGTLGRAIVSGASHIKIFGEDISVRAKIHTLGGLSAHAGQDQLLEWASHMKDKKPRLYLIHGELDSMQALQKRFVKDYNWNANIPNMNEIITL